MGGRARSRRAARRSIRRVRSVRPRDRSLPEPRPPARDARDRARCARPRRRSRRAGASALRAPCARRSVRELAPTAGRESRDPRRGGLLACSAARCIATAAAAARLAPPKTAKRPSPVCCTSRPWVTASCSRSSVSAPCRHVSPGRSPSLLLGTRPSRPILLVTARRGRRCRGTGTLPGAALDRWAAPTEGCLALASKELSRFRAGSPPPDPTRT